MTTLQDFPAAAGTAFRVVRAVIYCRISRDKVGAGLGVERQEGDCRSLASRLPLPGTVEIVRVLVDNDRSAYSGRRRKGYEELCRMLRDGEVDAVLSWHTDRVHRSPRELEDYIDFSNLREVPTFTVTAGDYDLTTSNGRFQARIHGAIARRESEHRSERVTSAAQQRAYSGHYNGGPRPFGFEPDGETIRWGEAVEIAGSTTRLLSGVTMKSEIRSLEARGIVSTNGKPFSATTWAYVLLRPRNAALLSYQGKEIGLPAPWDEIVTVSEYRALCLLLNDEGRRVSPGNQPKWLCSLIVTCGGDGCGKGVTRSARTGRNKVYRCQIHAAGHAIRDAESLDAFIALTLRKRLSRPDAAKLLRKGSGEDVGKLYVEKAALTTQLEELGVAIGRGLSALTAVKATAEIERQIQALDVRIEAAAIVDPVAAVVGAEDVAATWEALHMDVKRAIFRELLDVKVFPHPQGGRVGGPDDPMTGLELTWRRGA